MGEGKYEEMWGLCHYQPPPEQNTLDAPCGVWRTAVRDVLIVEMTNVHLLNAVRRICAGGNGSHAKCLELLDELRRRLAPSQRTP
jgi:hypothetical protein